METGGKVDHIYEGMAVGGTGPQLFIKSDFQNMVSQAIFIVTGEPEDDVLLIPTLMRELVDILGLDVDLGKWREKFDKEIEGVEIETDDEFDFKEPKDNDYE